MAQQQSEEQAAEQQGQGDEPSPFVDDTTGADELVNGHRERGTARPITVVGDPVLHRPCEPVTSFDDELAKLIDDMFSSMEAAEGVGLAANQIGVGLRVFVYDCPDDDGVRHAGHVINPVLDDVAPERRRLDESGEGCLSVPGAYMDLARPDYAAVRGQDRHGNPIAVQGSGYFARCLQHETDHLNGYLYIDRLSKRERRDVLKQMAESTPKYETAPHG